MRNLFSAFLFSMVALSAIAGGAVALPVSAGELRVEYDYPDSSIDDESRPIFADDLAWAKAGGTVVGDVVRHEEIPAQVAGSIDEMPDRDQVQADCLGNLDSEGEPVGPRNPACF